eukprot:Nk52_evm9s1569 gene=Nk52_evmTU9s1569
MGGIIVEEEGGRGYSWEESSEEIVVVVPLRGVSRRTVDVYVSDVYVKVNYPPYLVEIDLLGRVDDMEGSAAVFEGGAVKIRLQKDVRRRGVVKRVSKETEGGEEKEEEEDEEDEEKEHRKKWQALLAYEEGVDGWLYKEVKEGDGGLWGRLECEVKKQKDKEAVRARRVASIERHTVKEQLTARDKAVKKQKTKRLAVNKQLDAEQRKRDKVKSMKDEQQKEIMEDIERWKMKELQVSLSETDCEGDDKEAEKEEKKKEEKKKEEKKKEEKKKEEKKEEDKDGEKEGVKKQDKEKENMNEVISDTKAKETDAKGAVRQASGGPVKIVEVEVAATPPPRQTGVISTSFTKRAFVNPARESREEEEAEWLEKMATREKHVQQKRLQADKEGKDLASITEKSPEWLKDKGDRFFRGEDYASAINAYTEALTMDPHRPSLHSNRAACFLALHRYHDCVRDCNTALQLLTPPVESNRMQRQKVHLRRAAAYARLNQTQNAKQDLQVGQALSRPLA